MKKILATAAATLFASTSWTIDLLKPVSLRAQDCDAAISDVLLEINSRGALIENTWKSNADDYPGNPFPGSQHLVIALSGTGAASANPARASKIANNIMMSSKLNQTWATQILSACPDLAVVGFGMYRTGWQNTFYRFKDGRVRPKVCVSELDQQPVWGVGWCD